MKRTAQPNVSPEGLLALNQYNDYLQHEQDLSADTRRNYLSDLRQFAAWCEASWSEGQEATHAFAPTAIATALLTQYRAYLQTVCKLQPATINRHLVSLKRYFAWAAERGEIGRDPAKVVKLVPLVRQPPRHLTDQEENALVAAVTTHGTLRDRAVLILALHTGLRAEELCTLQRSNVTLGKRSGQLAIYGKRNKYREVPLNGTARAVLAEYLPTLPTNANWLFASNKQETLPDGSKQPAPLTERGLGYLVAKYARMAKVDDLSPHDLRHRFGYRMAQTVPLHRLAQIMGHDSLDTTTIYVQGTKQDLQQAVEAIAWA
ncbi:MAG: tyrosine-type recombinase/integrase [Chloroflexota bacterium]|nr:tyrosine-type recombinase/integrase [Chloroflexota bacterium]